MPSKPKALNAGGESSWRCRLPSRQTGEPEGRRFLENRRVCVEKLYLPLAMAALKDWQNYRLYLAIDTTVLWNRFCISYKVWRDGNRHRQLCADSYLSSLLWSGNSAIMACVGT